MNHIIGQILYAYLLDDNQVHWPDYLAVTEMAINSTINASINKALFELLYGENTPLPVDLLLFRESSIDPHTHIFSSNIKKLISLKMPWMVLKKLKNIFMTESIRTRHFL